MVNGHTDTEIIVEQKAPQGEGTEEPEEAPKEAPESLDLFKIMLLGLPYKNPSRFSESVRPEKTLLSATGALLEGEPGGVVYQDLPQALKMPALHGLYPEMDASWMLMPVLPIIEYFLKKRAANRILRLEDSAHRVYNALEELSNYMKNAARTPGQMGGRYDLDTRLGRAEVLLEDYARSRVRQERTRSGIPIMYNSQVDVDNLPPEQTHLEAFAS